MLISLIVAAATNDVIYVTDSTNGIVISVDSLIANDRDVDGMALAITGVSAVSGINSLALNPNGTITFNSNNVSTGSFTYTLSDGTSSTTGTVNINMISTSNGNGKDG